MMAMDASYTTGGTRQKVPNVKHLLKVLNTCVVTPAVAFCRLFEDLLYSIPEHVNAYPQVHGQSSSASDMRNPRMVYRASVPLPLETADVALQVPGSQSRFDELCERGEMREDTAFGPVWLFPDFLPEKAAKHGARLELLWPNLEGFTAMHTGPPTGGGWVVRAPMAALERAGLPTDSAAEHPVKEGTVWPPIHIPVPNRLVYNALPIGPEQLYKQDEQKQRYDEHEGHLERLSESAQRDQELRERREQAYGESRGSGRPAFE